MISTTEVSVVVQGPVSAVTASTLRSVRTHLPGAELILSTWEGTDCSGLDADLVVISSDPGSLISLGPHNLSSDSVNVNRMIDSSIRGLAAASREFVVKLRSDAMMEHGGCLELMSDLAPVEGDWKLFEHMVAVSSVYTRDPEKAPSGCFHPADTVQFGHLEDLRLLWDVPHMPAADAVYFPYEEERPMWSMTSVRYYAEQWVFLAALRKRHEVHFEHRNDLSSATVDASHRSLVQNFVVLEPWQMGMRIDKLERLLRWAEDPTWVMTHPIWASLRESVSRTPSAQLLP
jgi:hypothetical protein